MSESEYLSPLPCGCRYNPSTAHWRSCQEHLDVGALVKRLREWAVLVVADEPPQFSLAELLNEAADALTWGQP